MSHADPAARSDPASRHSIHAQVALGYEPPTDRGDGRIWIPMGGSHRVTGLSETQKASLLSAVLDLKPEPGAKLVLLGLEVGGLDTAERAPLLAPGACTASSAGPQRRPTRHVCIPIA